MFKDERGIDAGGLKREFYEMAGDTLKDARVKLFEAILQENNTTQYYFHQDIKNVKDSLKFIFVAGKLFAHTIKYQELLSIDMIPPFYKLLFE
jgi:hypothetical protein